MSSWIPSIPADDWNRTVSDARRARPLQGMHVRLFETPEGTTVSAEIPEDEYPHPWQLRCRAVPRLDDPARMEWHATVRPGFVNGRDVTIDMRGREESRRLDVALIDEEKPFLVLEAWRNPISSAGTAASIDGEMVALPGEGYPPFFQSLGVRPAERGGSLESAESTPPPDPSRNRELRALDVVLITPRLATRNDIEALDPFSTASTFNLSAVFVNDAALGAGSRHRLATVPKWQPPREPDAVERLLGTAVEPQTDEIRIATVWMVSPPDTAPDAVPDETWKPYVQYAVFWNLHHDTRREIPSTPQPSVTVNTGIPLADFLGNLITAPVNDAFTQIVSFLSSADFSGRYWT